MPSVIVAVSVLGCIVYSIILILLFNFKQFKFKVTKSPFFMSNILKVPELETSTVIFKIGSLHLSNSLWT